MTLAGKFICFDVASCSVSLVKSRCFFGCILHGSKFCHELHLVLPLATKKLIKQCNAIAVTLHLGAYGAFTLKPVSSPKLFFNALSGQ